MHRRIIETLLIYLLFALFAGQLPPDVNESHYLTKAKHSWDPAWCSGDLFLASSFSHWLFYLTFGWLNQFFSLSVVAWIGRLLTWFLLAFAWQRLSDAVLKTPGLSIVAAAFFLIINDRFHLAGEWVVGGFEAKGLAYAFVLLALGSLIRKNYHWLWPQLGLACAFHVLVGGWATIAVLVSIVATSRCNVSVPKSSSIQPSHRLEFMAKFWLPLGFGGLLALAGVLPPLLADLTADPAAKEQASYIYVVERISHHLSFGDFSATRVACFASALVTLAALHHFSKRLTRKQQARWQSLLFFTAGSLAISFLGLLLSGLSESDNSLSSRSIGLLRFYWFRLSDFAVPLALSFGSLTMLQNNLAINQQYSNPIRRRFGKFSALLFITAIAMATSLLILERYTDLRPRADQAALPHYPDSPTRTLQTYQNWRRACEWVKANTPTDAIFITPDQQQTFKWYAHRSEVVNWKDVPQDAQSMVDWRQRVALFIEPQRRFPQGLLAYSDEQLTEYAGHFDATHLLVPQRHADLVTVPSKFKQVYPANPTTKATYVVYEIPTNK